MLERGATLWDGACKGRRKEVKKEEQNTETLEEGCSFLFAGKMAWGGFKHHLRRGSVFGIIFQTLPLSKAMLICCVISHSSVELGVICWLEVMPFLVFEERRINGKAANDPLIAGSSSQEMRLICLGLHGAKRLMLITAVEFR